MKLDTLPAILVALLAVTLLTSCGDDNGASFNLEGVYTIDTWTENEMGCDQEGDSILEQETNSRFVATRVTDPLVNQQLIIAGACSDPQSCSDSASGGALGAAFSGLAAFPLQSQGDAWVTEGSAAFGPDQDNQCSGSYTEITLLSPGEGLIRMESRFTEDIEFQAVEVDGEMDCDLDQLPDLAQDLPCSRLEVITASNPESVPPPQNNQ